MTCAVCTPQTADMCLMSVAVQPRTTKARKPQVFTPVHIAAFPHAFLGALPVFSDGKLFNVSGAAGSSKLDQLESLDIFAVSASYAFGERMRTEVQVLLQGLEVWAEKQAAGMELAAQPDTLASNFESLLRVRA